MKKYFYTVLLSAVIMIVKQSPAQSYREMMNHPNGYSLKQIQDAFYSERNKKQEIEKKEAHEEVKGGEEEGEEYQFKRWEEFMAMHLDEQGRIFNYNAKNQEEIEKMQQTLRDAPIETPNWTPIGPLSYFNAENYQGGIGRVNCIAFHPSDPDIIWAGTPSGGLWKTVDHGNSWIPLTDSYNAGIGVSGIAVNPENPDVIYILTGDGDGLNRSSIGVLKTTNGGITWNKTALSFAAKHYVQAYKLLMHPQHPDIMLVATSDGVYKTTDGFVTKKRKLNDKQVYDIEFNPENPEIVYLATDGNFYRSTNTGDSWNNITAKTTDGLPDPLPNIRIAIAVSPDAPDRVVAAYADDKKFIGLYVSDNKGKSFTQHTVNTDFNIMGSFVDGAGTKTQAFYDFTLLSLPYQANTLILGGINLWKSTDEGATWFAIADGYSQNNPGDAPYVHPDQHALEINPLNNEIYVGCDGGIYLTADTGKTWQNRTAGMAITQMYHATAIDPANSTIYYGAQDNGGNALPVNSTTAHTVLGGDGGVTAFKDGKVFFANNYGGLYRGNSSDITTATSLVKITPPGVNGPQFSHALIYHPFVVDPVTPNTIWAAYDSILKSSDNGDHWQRMYTSSDEITRLAISSSNPQAMFYYIPPADLERLTDDFVFMDAGLPFSSGISISDICLADSSSLSDHYVWVSFGGYAGNKKVYRTNNTGTTWINYSDGLPNVPVNCLAYMPKSKVHLTFAGTDIGVYYRDTTMESWLPFNTGMPYVSVTDLDVDTANHLLIAATFGRGLWKAQLSCTSSLTEAQISGENLLCAGETLTLTADGPCGFDSYLWSTSDTTQSIDVTSDGIYTVTLTNSDGNTLKAAHAVCSSGADVLPCLLAQYNYGGSDADSPTSIRQTTDKGFIVAGATRSSDGDVVGFHGGDPPENIDAWILKLDRAGNIEWKNCYGDVYTDYATTIRQTFDGGYIVGGLTSPGKTGVGSDYWIFKLNPDGTLDWQKLYGGDNSDFVTSIVQVKEDSGYLAIGTVGQGGGDVDDFIGGFACAWAIRMDKDGELLWKKTFVTGGGGPLIETANATFVTWSGGYLIKFNLDSTLIWKTKMNSVLGFGGSSGLIQTSDSGYAMTSLQFPNGNSQNHGGYDYGLIKADTNGNTIWAKAYGGALDDIPSGIAQTDEGNYVIAGTSRSAYYANLNNDHIGGADIWVIETDPNGEIIWSKSLGGTADDATATVENVLTKTTDGTIVIAGNTASFDGDVTENNGSTDEWVVELGGGCPRPYKGFSTTDISSSSATIHWGIRECVEEYKITYGLFADPLFIQAGTALTSAGEITLNNLNPNSTYLWYVQSACGALNNPMLSKPSPDQFFTTLPVKTGSEHNQAFDCTVYPNPASGSFTLAVNASAEGYASIQINSLLGKPVYADKLPLNEGNNIIPFNAVLKTPGMYVLTIEFNGQRIVRKIMNSR